jgi:transcriptional regulator with XRE-family HTH domain
MSSFGERIRQLRKGKNLSQRELADKVGVNFTYLSKIENGKLDFSDYPSEVTIRKLARALEANADDLLLLAEKIPETIKQRVIERPDAFRKFADLSDKQLDEILERLKECPEEKPKSKRTGPSKS